MFLFKQEQFLRAEYFSINKSKSRQQVLQNMASLVIEHIVEPRTHSTPDKSHNSDSTVISSKLQCVHDKQIILNQNGDEDVFDEEMSKKKNESKQRYRRLKQKLASLCSEHQEKCLFKNNKQVSSSNKSRLLTLAIEFEKMTLNQTKDYSAIESKLKQIYKILDLKLECDLFTLKQSRFVPAFSVLLKKVPTFHKNEFFQAVKTIELGLKVLRIFCTTSVNRDYMISTNQLSTLNSCLSSFIGKEQKKLAIECLNVLFELLCAKIKSDSEQIINITLQIVFFGQVVKKLRQSIDQCITQEGTIEEQYVIKCLKYLYILYRKVFEKYLQRPVYQQPEVQTIFQNHIDSLLSQLYHLLPVLLLDTDSQEPCLKQEELPICYINIVLYVCKLINLCTHVSYRTAQKIMDIHDKNSPFVRTVGLVYLYAMANMEICNEMQNVYCQIVDFFAKICCQSEENRKSLATNGLLNMIYDHPIVCIMDHRLKSVLIPALCSIMDQSEVNMKRYLSENSAQNIINYITAQKKRYEQTQMKHVQEDSIKEISNIENLELELEEDMTGIRNLSRKQSVSSLNSYTTQCTQNSCLPMAEDERSGSNLCLVVPYSRWEPLMAQLKCLDC